MERKQFTFYQTFYTAIRKLNRKSDRCDAYEAVFEYALFGKVPDLKAMQPAVSGYVELILPTLASAWKKAQGGANGCPGTKKIPKREEKDTAKEIELEVELEKELETEYECIYTDIIGYLNEKTGKAYKSTSRKTRSAIHARLEEGFRPEDFKAVIDRKCIDWLGDPKMEEFLRPETLFGTKFESYLNAGGNHGTIAGATGENRLGHYL